MPPKLRCEFYLPSYYNDKTPIEAKKYRYVKNKLLMKFGGVSVHPATVEGLWKDPKTSIIYSDNSYKFEITVEKNDESKKFFEEFKEELKVIFKQHQIYMLCTEVDMI